MQDYASLVSTLQTPACMRDCASLVYELPLVCGTTLRLFKTLQTL